jgi:hypothetical protein
MPVLTTTQRVQELLIVLGENASVWFDFDEQLIAFQALDEFTLQGRVTDDLSSGRIQATDPGVVLSELRDCLQLLLRGSGELQDVLRYSRVLDLITPLLPRRPGE